MTSGNEDGFGRLFCGQRFDWFGVKGRVPGSCCAIGVHVATHAQSLVTLDAIMDQFQVDR